MLNSNGVSKGYGTLIIIVLFPPLTKNYNYKYCYHNNYYVIYYHTFLGSLYALHTCTDWIDIIQIKPPLGKLGTTSSQQDNPWVSTLEITFTPRY